MQFRHILTAMAEDKDRPSNNPHIDETTVKVELKERESWYYETHVYNKTVEIDMSVVECLGHARIDWERVRRCTREEKEQAARLIDRLVKMEEQIRIEGDAVAYKDFINTLDDPFQETAMLLLFNDYEYETVSNILYNFIVSSDLPDGKYLEYLLFTRYVLEAKKNVYRATDWIRVLLTSYLGVEFIRPEMYLHSYPHGTEGEGQDG